MLECPGVVKQRQTHALLEPSRRVLQVDAIGLARAKLHSLTQQVWLAGDKLRQPGVPRRTLHTGTSVEYEAQWPWYDGWWSSQDAVDQGRTHAEACSSAPAPDGADPARARRAAQARRRAGAAAAVPAAQPVLQSAGYGASGGVQARLPAPGRFAVIRGSDELTATVFAEPERLSKRCEGRVRHTGAE